MIEKWTEVRTAYQVARLGTVSAAAEALGLHRATVLRHIDLLERELGEKLFIRHAHGYTPTQAGEDLMLVAQATEERFETLEARIRARTQINGGSLMITSLPVVAPILMPSLAAFREAHPDVRLRHVATSRSLKLEKGEAHVAVRAAPHAEEPDNVVQTLTRFRLGLFASEAYLERRGAPKTLADLADHDFVAPEFAAASNTAKQYAYWLKQLAPKARVVFRSTDLAAVDAAIEAGIGLGFMPEFAANTKLGLRQILHRSVFRWGEMNVVTHVDFHRTPRIQALVGALKTHFPRAIGALTGDRSSAPPADMRSLASAAREGAR